MSRAEYAASTRLLKAAANDAQISVTTSSATVTYATIALRQDRYWALQALGGDVYLLCDSAAGSVTTTTGQKIADGETLEACVPLGTDRVHVIGSASCVLNIWEAGR